MSGKGGGPIDIRTVARDRLSHELDVVAQRLASGTTSGALQGGTGSDPGEADGRRNISAAEGLAGFWARKNQIAPEALRIADLEAAPGQNQRGRPIAVRAFAMDAQKPNNGARLARNPRKTFS
jgi:hypothetical protein